MSREAISFETHDISALARSLRGQLAGRATAPGHVEMLNMLARAAGHRNFQHLRAQAGARNGLAAAAVPAESVDHLLVERTARHFDRAGRLIRWPSRASQQALCLWALWARMPQRRILSERAVNDLLKAQHLFGDHAILRRSLCDRALLSRTIDGTEYRRVERPPTAEAAALIRHLKPRLG